MELFNHQKEAFNFAIANDGCVGLCHSVGTGKTRTAIEIFKRIRIYDSDSKLFVICPISIIEDAWFNNLRKFSDLLPCNLRDKYNPDDDVYIINFEALINEKRLKEYVKIIPKNAMCVIDESSRMKNPKAATTKAILSLRDKFRYRVCMSGTPAPNLETEYWAQTNFIMPDIVNKNFYAFRNTYFHLSRGKQVLEVRGQKLDRATFAQLFAKGFNYAITAEKRVELMSALSKIWHFADKDECLDLPDEIDEIRYVSLSPDLSKLYKQMKNDLVIEIKNEMVAAPVALTKLMKLRQITSNFIIKEGEPFTLTTSNPKLRELEAILEEIGNKPVIIWAIFHEEIKAIKELLKDKACSLYGETKASERQDNINGFINGQYQYLIAHPKSAGHGLTFVNSSTQIFYSLDYSWELYIQARARTMRIGQKSNCTYIHIMAKDTVDENIYRCLKRKGDAHDIIKEIVGT